MMSLEDLTPAEAPLLTVYALADALEAEARLIESLGSLLANLRQAVADDDVEALERCVYSNHRILATISEARRRRSALADLLGINAGNAGSNGLAQHFATLREAASLLEREVEATRQVLRGALDTGDALIRAACGPAPAATYDSAAIPVAGATGTQPTFLRQKA